MKKTNRKGNSIVYRNSKWWVSIIWWYRTILFSKWWMSTIWWRSIIWWKVTIILDAIPLEMACRPVRVHPGEWKVVIRVNQKMGGYSCALPAPPKSGTRCHTHRRRGWCSAWPGVVGIVVVLSSIQSDLPPQWRQPLPRCCRQGPPATVPLSVFEIGIKDRGYPFRMSVYPY